MKRVPLGLGVLRPLLLGMLLGALAATWWLATRAERQQQQQRLAQTTNWPPREFNSGCNWHYLRVDASGWSTGPIGTFQDLGSRFRHLLPAATEVVIPIFPSVYAPSMIDKLYYNAILQSEIAPGDKVLVIGTGSGADAWVASLKSKAPVYAVEINPMATVNAQTTARLAQFDLRIVVGDIRETELPADFSDFDFVLWNMPYLDNQGKIALNTFHDGDDGSILKGFLARLPALLKPTGRAMLLNVPEAAAYIATPGVTTQTDGTIVLFTIPRP
ncbi:MAG: methyltransferase [Verrucomicrobia bacterium]|nr:methyltransferase [Verrucomicrobiota bacterium]